MRTLRRVFPESFKREAVDGVVARGLSAPPPSPADRALQVDRFAVPERAAADGARHPEKAALIFGAAR